MTSPPVGVDHVNADLVLAPLAAIEAQADGDGALRVDGWHLPGVDRIKCPEDIEFADGVSGCVAQHERFDFHGSLSCPDASQGFRPPIASYFEAALSTSDRQVRKPDK